MIRFMGQEREVGLTAKEGPCLPPASARRTPRGGISAAHGSGTPMVKRQICVRRVVKDHDAIRRLCVRALVKDQEARVGRSGGDSLRCEL